MDFFNPPSEGSAKRSASKTGSLRSFSSRASSPKPRETPVHSDLFGMRTTDIPHLARDKTPRLQFPSSASVVSNTSSASSGSAGTAASSSTKASSVAEMIPTGTIAESSEIPPMKSLSHHDLFGTKLPPTEAELAPVPPNAVQLAGGAYSLPEAVDKQFFKDMTFLEDDELIQKYALVEVPQVNRTKLVPVETSKKGRRRAVLSVHDTSFDIVKFV